ncbi:hypothetical protein MSG28_001325 [Choristoneura fumiferana]|uniref:Uncharacterized protein n=1 Tax=Choristoneura fumiferana TaxID=7141 RepID=A0ACC0KTD1_CHOFU|nr:hypothetical protein MSG28_001325 [Choristoneura fumiferana]
MCDQDLLLSSMLISGMLERGWKGERWKDEGPDTEGGTSGHGTHRPEVPHSAALTTGSLGPAPCSGRHRAWWSVALAALSMLAKETGLTALLFNVAFNLYKSWPGARCSFTVKWRWKGEGACARVSVALGALALLAAARVAVLQGSLPAFSPQDNPPAFHPSFFVRTNNRWGTKVHEWQPQTGRRITGLTSACRSNCTYDMFRWTDDMRYESQTVLVENQRCWRLTPQHNAELMTFCYLAAFNWWLLLCPWTLSHDWQMGSVPLVTSGWDPRNLLTCAALIALLALSYRCLVDLELQRHTPAVAGLMLLVIPYLPASNLLVTVGFVVAERVLYLPSVGSVILTAYGLQLLWRHWDRRWLVVGAAVLVAGGATRTQLRNGDWRTRETLLRADLAVLPHNAKLHYNFANFLKDMEQQENAVKHYKEALKLWPSYASAHNNLGTLVLASGRAEHHFLQALKYNRDHVNAHYNLAKLYRRKNRLSDALKMLERCITLEPRFVQAYLELLLLKPEEEKRSILEKLLELEPRNWEHYILYGNWLKGRGLLPLSLNYYSSALRLSFGAQEARSVAALRAACLALRQAGQGARLLQMMTRWHVVRSDGRSARSRALAARAWRLRSELEGRAALYARPRDPPPQTTSTCLHHSQLEIKEPNLNQYEMKTASTKIIKSFIHDTKYKPIHNKSETGHKQKSCSLRKKEMKDPEAFTPFVSDHLIKTY